MTKITVFGEHEINEEKKPIEIVKRVFADGVYKVNITAEYASQYDNVCLLGWFTEDYELIMCWDDAHQERVLYLGHWNDGIV